MNEIDSWELGELLLEQWIRRWISTASFSRIKRTLLILAKRQAVLFFSSHFNPDHPIPKCLMHFLCEGVQDPRLTRHKLGGEESQTKTSVAV